MNEQHHLVGRLTHLQVVEPAGSVSHVKRGDHLVTEDAAAQQFAELYSDRLRYCHDSGSWYEWTGSIWRQNRTGLAFQWSRLLARELAEKEPDRIRFVSSKTSFAAGVERFARSDPAFAVTNENWDANIFLLGTPSGTVDLRTGELIEADPNDGITKSVATAPAIAADCPLWLRFINEATGGDAALMRFLQQYLGYCLTGSVKEHALLFIHGNGGEGKSVFQDTSTKIIGDYAKTAGMETFVASTGDRHPTEIATLRGARLVSAAETEEGRAWAEARIKTLTGGDRVSARFMRQDAFEFQPQFKLVIVGNHRPVLRNVDEAARRRFNIVPFRHRPARPDRDLETKLRAEWPGILRWMIDGCLDWQRNGLIRPQSVVDATAEYFADQDIVGQFLSDECECEPGNAYKSVMTGELFSAWSTYAKAAGEAPGSAKAFTTTLMRRGFERGRINKARAYKGVRLKVKAGWEQ